MTTPQRLPPWRELPAVACELCNRQATRRVFVSGLDVLGPNTLTFTDAGKGAALACEHHYDELMDRFTDIHGGAGAEPLRDGWLGWFWFTCPATRWLGRVETALWNWRTNRSAP